MVEPGLVSQWDGEFLERSFDRSRSYFCLWIRRNWAGCGALRGIFSGWLPEGDTFHAGRARAAPDATGWEEPLLQSRHNRFPGLNPTSWAPRAGCSIQPSWASGSVGSVCHNPVRESQRCLAFKLAAIPTRSLLLAGADTRFPHSRSRRALLPAGTTGAAIFTYPWDTKHPPSGKLC